MEPIDWTQAGVKEPHHQLFILQWAELFSEESLDTWQVRTSNLLTLLKEIEQACRVATLEFGPARYAIPELIDECLSSIERDLVLKEECPYVRQELSEMAGDLGSRPEVDGRRSKEERDASSVPDATRLKAVERRAGVLCERVRRIYRPAIIKKLRALLSGDGKQKEEQLLLTMSLATELSAQGFSVQHFRAVGDLLLQGPAGFLERFDNLVSVCEQGERPFQVLFVVQEWEEGVEPQREGAWIRPRHEAETVVPPTPRGNEFFARALENDRVVSIETKARDPFSARNQAEALLANDFAALAFTTFRDPKLKLNHDALVVDLSAKFVSVAPTDWSRRKPLVRSHDWEARTRVLLRMGKILLPEEAHRLSATLQYYRLAVTHPSDEVRLVNLWVAAENLVRRAGEGSIIGSVTRFLAPLLALRNIRRVARGFARRLTGAVSYKKLREVGLLERNAKQIDPQQLLTTLKKNDRANAVLALLDHDPLLRFRLGRFADRALKDGPSAARYLEANARNIGWQLGRIYRARNAIVHRGEAPQATRQLLQHLQTYVWTSIRQVMSELEAADGRWSLNEALEHWRSLYFHAVRVTQASAEAPIPALVEPELFLGMAVPAKPGKENEPPRGPKA